MNSGLTNQSGGIIADNRKMKENIISNLMFQLTNQSYSTTWPNIYLPTILHVQLVTLTRIIHWPDGHSAFLMWHMWNITAMF